MSLRENAMKFVLLATIFLSLGVATNANPIQKTISDESESVDMARKLFSAHEEDKLNTQLKELKAKKQDQDELKRRFDKKLEGYGKDLLELSCKPVATLVDVKTLTDSSLVINSDKIKPRFISVHKCMKCHSFCGDTGTMKMSGNCIPRVIEIKEVVVEVKNDDGDASYHPIYYSEDNACMCSS